jgi:hypothetical protein
LRSKNYLLVVLTVVAVGATTLAWRQWLELATLRARGLSDDERSALEARLADFKKRNFELQTDLASLRAGNAADGAVAGDEHPANNAAAKASEAAVLKSLADAAADPAMSKRDEDMELLAALADLPEFQRMLALQQRGKVDEKYAALFKKLKLSPEELTRLQTLLGDRQTAFADAMMAASAQGLTGKDARQVANDVARASQKDITANIKDLLGPQRFNQLQTYERTLPQRETVDQLTQRLSYTTTPLTARQQDQLVQVLATAAAAPKANATVAGAGLGGAQNLKPAQPIAALPNAFSGIGLGAGSQAPIVNAAVNQAQTFLSPQQVGALQQMQQEQRAQQTLGNLLRTGTVNPPPKTVAPVKPNG